MTNFFLGVLSSLTATGQVARMNAHLISARDSRRMNRVRSRVLGYAIGIWGSVAAVSCSHDTPVAPSPPGPAGVSFAISLPIRPQDYVHHAFGVNPFGAHIGDHGIDGHPGWDLEYVIGAPVLAAADGLVQSVTPGSLGTEWSIQLTHRLGGRDAYRTIYGVASVASGVMPGAAVVSGQILGIVNSYTRTIGSTVVTYAFTHFQLDDFSTSAVLTNRNAVSPESFLTTDAKREFDAMWAKASYSQELTEPYVTNPRDVSFPMTRLWLLSAGGLTAQLEITRASASAIGFSYVMRDNRGAITEAGLVEVDPVARPVAAIDFTPAVGGAQKRRGVYSIVDGAMQLDYGAPGAPRPASLDGASRYVTTR